MKEKNNKTGLKELIRLTKPKKSWLMISAMASVLASLVSLAVPMIIQKMVDKSFSGISLQEGVLVIALFVGQALFNCIAIYLLVYTGHFMVKEIRMKLAHQSIYFPVSYFQVERPGELVSRTINDTNLIKDFVSENIPTFISGVVTLSCATVILFYMDWKMTLIIFLAIPIVAIAIVPLGKKIFSISKKTQEETALFSADFGQILSALPLVKVSNGEEKAEKEMENGINKLFEFGKREAKIIATLNPIMSIVVMGIIMGIVAYGGYRVSQGTLSAGTLIAFILYLFQVVSPIIAFGTFFTSLQKVNGATERIIKLLDEPIEDLTTGESVNVNDGSISFEKVDFSYNKETVLLQQINFYAQQNQTVAFVGPSGSGKSTLFSLIESFYQPKSGKIKYGKKDITEFSLKEWRRKIGYVQQESMMLSGSIRDNLTFGLEREVTEKELDSVMELACGKEIIDRLPEGYHSLVGEKGSLLSGGERQRIAIARAFLRNPDILLLDEATASLDSHSEKVVQEGLQNLMENRTTLVIAHRLSTVVNADKIIFLDHGEITGIGTHQELLENHKMYREFSMQQLTN
ncbi:MAG: ABC transporter ATP-binding protein [Vagococcus sp.]|uniref:ABC transporter ATP-binding protein n=1 Tax=Vagococcus sp. TaxID=1933889 RepID=UPI002FC7AB63